MFPNLLRSFHSLNQMVTITLCNGLFTLLERDSDTDSDSDSKPDGYIALCRTYSYRTDSDSDFYFLLLYRTEI